VSLPMDLHISPEPSEEERAAILAALATEEDEPPAAPWQEQEA
jgi:hypothetical protein